MPFVRRDSTGMISGRYACQQDGYAEEFVPDDAPEIVKLEDDAMKAAEAVKERDEKMAAALDEIVNTTKTLDQIRADFSANRSRT